MSTRHWIPCTRCGRRWDLAVPWTGDTTGLVRCQRTVPQGAVDEHGVYSLPGPCGVWVMVERQVPLFARTP